MAKSKLRELREDYEARHNDDEIDETRLARFQFEGDKLRQAVNLETDGFHLEAIEIFKEIVENAHSPSGAHRKLWQHYRKLEMYEQEIEVIESYLSLFSEEPYIRFLNECKIEKAEKRLHVARRLLIKKPG